MLGLALSACTFEPGTGFSTLEQVRVLASAPDTFRTDLGHDVVLDRLEIEPGALALQELVGGSGGFDPADPPEGFTLCHNGHCHADDGSLPTYAEVEAMLSGEGASWDTVVEVVLGTIEPLTEVPLIAEGVRPSPSLPASDIGHLALPVIQLVLGGQVGTDRLEVVLRSDLVLGGSLSLPVDRRAEPRVALDVELQLSPDLLDGIDWPTLAIDGLVSIEAPDDPGAQALLDGLSRSYLAAEAQLP